ncbi:MAG: tail fiber protein [Polaribacter sp.]|uniref:phage tail protein n=1 Tax=Polaribacter sp. TaxID=1920175 RepID=UPI003264EAD9
MDEDYIGVIKMFAGNFAPRNWAYCDGQLLAIAQHQALFSIIGNTYGGDGRTSFALPDMRGRAPIHAGSGSGPGLSPYKLAAKGGLQLNFLNQLQLPYHTHTASGTTAIASVETSPVESKFMVSSAAGTLHTPVTNSSIAAGVVPENRNSTPVNMFNEATPDIELNGLSFSGGNVGKVPATPVSVNVNPTGGNQAVNNMQPYLAINYIICMVGSFPSRS